MSFIWRTGYVGARVSDAAVDLWLDPVGINRREGKEREGRGRGGDGWEERDTWCRDKRRERLMG